MSLTNGNNRSTFETNRNNDQNTEMEQNAMNLLLTKYVFLSLSFQALNGFLMILTCEGEVFFATHSIESYLGFHQVSPLIIWKFQI